MARRTTTIRRLRTLLLLALVFTVLAVAGLFLFGRAGKPKPQAMEPGDTEAGEGVTLIGDDFDYTFTERERPIFRIRGDSIRADREDTLFLDKVGVTFYDENRQPYHVESKEASFNRANNEGRLQGDVLLRGPSNLELRTAQLQIRENGKQLFMPKPVELRYAGAYIINGDRMRVDLKDELFVLNGNTRINSVPGTEPAVEGASDRAIYERQNRVLRIEGHARLRRGPQRIQAQRITGFLTPDESSLTFVRALWDVSGQSASIGPASAGNTLVKFKGKDLSVTFRPQGNEVKKVELDGTDNNRAVLETSGEGIVRTLTAQRFDGILAEGVLSQAEAHNGVDLVETSRAQAPGGQREVRKASGRRAEAVFRPDGQLADVRLMHDVTFEDPQVKAKGNRASLDLDTHRGELFGQPVELESEKGNLQAPRVVYDTENKIVNAQGGVRAVLTQVSSQELAATPLGGDSEGPVRVDAREAFWRQEPSSFIFRGDVKTWRGENLMLSNELKGEPDADRLTASGGVKTIWIPEDEAAGKPAGKQGAAPPAKGTGGTGAPQRNAPIEVRASELVYLQGKKVLTYTGGVRVEQQGTTLACQRLDVTMNQENKPQVMTCTGQAKLNDPKGGRQIEGETAVYRLDQRDVEFTGEKVTMKDREGNVVQGRRVLYLIDTGKVEVKGKTQAPAAPTGAGG
jgi:LPS export ABC transporter protein LptC/lipopolysaccharide transport protein LptA